MARLISVILCGRNTFIGDGTTLTDFRLDGKTIRVLKDDRLIDTQNIFMGSCLGHDVYLGSGCIIAPGRAVPNAYKIYVENSRIISKLPNKNPDFGYGIMGNKE